MDRTALVIDDSEDVRHQLATFLRHRGYHVLIAKDGIEGLQAFRSARSNVIFVDLRMPRMDGVEFLREALLIDPEAHVIVITAYGNEEKILHALRLGAANFFKKPLDFQEVNEALSSLESSILASEGHQFDHTFLVEEGMKLEIPNDLNAVSPVVNRITASLKYVFDGQTVHGVQGALIEMIVNAIEHGNLGISYEEKTNALEEDRLNELILEKSGQPELARRRVHINYTLTQEKVLYEIEDEGDGFDIHDLPDPGEPENLWLGHGRGILMTRALMDEVHYSEKGNVVSLAKILPKLDCVEILVDGGPAEVEELDEIEELDEVEELDDIEELDEVEELDDIEGLKEGGDREEK